MIVALAGGVGGAKLAHGLYQALPPDELTIVVNTADDFELFGLRISPDADTVMYTLAGIANPETGWGVVGDTWQTLEMLGRYGYDMWFRLGDRDFATHIARTERLRAGQTLTEVTHTLATALGIRAALLPMCDQLVATQVATPDGVLPFQDYFVRRHHADTVKGVVFAGIEEATISASVADALRQARAIVFCPSNPIVSIGPILAVAGMREALGAARAPKVAVSPIVGGKALRGPADRMLADLGYEVSALGVARMYQGLIDGLVIDTADAALHAPIAALGMRVLVTHTVMHDERDRRSLAEQVLGFAAQLSAEDATIIK
ncbi:MAG TPA: 2-phospho-L-lactate transferase [Herpetosiphonaceae bacterium]